LIGNMRDNSTFIKHGHARAGKKTPTYNAWREMRRRCTVCGRPSDIYYASRGISVCDRWGSFDKFLKDMGEKPEGSSLDRIDSNGNYCPSNCRWASPTQQSRNRRSALMLEYKGQTKCLKEWAEHIGINYQTAHTRFQSGWSIAQIIETPVRRVL
jgi:hypothetical protein